MNPITSNIETKITIIGESHKGVAARKYILSNICDDKYPKGTVLALENVRTKHFGEQVTPSNLKYHLGNDQIELNSKYGLAKIITEAYKKGIYVTGIEDPNRAMWYFDTPAGRKKRLETVNSYAAEIINAFIELKAPGITVLCGLCHLDISLSPEGVAGIRQTFKQAESYIALDYKYKGEIPQGVLELPQPRRTCPQCTIL